MTSPLKAAVTIRSGTQHFAAQGVERGARSSRQEELAVEQPLEVRVLGDALALTMRTPGEERFLALGFLYAEGIITSIEDVGSVYLCGRSDEPGYGNVIEVTPGPGVCIPTEQLSLSRRTFATSSACGVCGRQSIADLIARCPTNADGTPIPAELIAQAPILLARGQTHFARTGGLHAACAIAQDGQILASAEDVGRHNAVDKVVGKLLYARLVGRAPPAADRPCVLAVSGRASFEIVQKAAMAGFACVASISAPSSLAVETARAIGLTLAAFVRGERFTLYAGCERVV